LYPDSELLAIKVFFASKVAITFICNYIPPNLSPELFEQNIQYLEKLCSTDGPLILLGDFNLPSIDWVKMIPGPGRKSARFFDFSTIHGLYQCVSKPTRVDNILDLVFSNDRALISDIVIKPPFGMSDHNSVLNLFPVAIQV
jgi:endonuclease/exonuclease/phosphatase (EEP) superfamily protein YafD